MRWQPVLLLLALLPSQLCTAEPPVTLEALQGTWKCIWFEYRGVKMDKLDTGARLIIKANEWTWAKGPKAKITLDPATSPIVIDLAYDEGMSEGICHLDGDKLTVCLEVEPGGKTKKRPIKFETEDGDGMEVIYFEREVK